MMLSINPRRFLRRWLEPSIRQAMDYTAVVAMMAAALLTGCAGSRSAAPPSVLYDFGLPVPALADSGDAKASFKAMGIAIDVRTPPWFDSPGIDYRLAYDDPLKRREYADSRWAANPGLLLTQRLRQQLGVPDAATGIKTVCALRIELQEFSQIFDSPQRSHGLLQAAATLTDTTQRVLAERQFLVEKPAVTPDARGGVGALVDAGKDLGQQLAGWLHALEMAHASRYPCRAATEPAKARRH